MITKKYRFKVLGLVFAICMASGLGVFFWSTFYGLDLFVRGQGIKEVCVSLEEPKGISQANKNCAHPLVLVPSDTGFVSPASVGKGKNVIWFTYAVNSQYVKSSCVIEMRHRICTAEVYLTPAGARCGTCDLNF